MQNDTTLDLSTLSHREHEVYEFVITDADWQRCQHGKPIVTVMAHWSDDAPFTVTTGQVNHTQRFPRTVHRDGSDGSEFEYNTVSKCPQCGALDTLSVTRGSYGDTTKCSECTYSSYYSIGD